MVQSDGMPKAFNAFCWMQNRCTQKIVETIVVNVSGLTWLWLKIGSSSGVLFATMRKVYSLTPSLWLLESFSTHCHMFTVALVGNGRHMVV